MRYKKTDLIVLHVKGNIPDELGNELKECKLVPIDQGGGDARLMPRDVAYGIMSQYCEPGLRFLIEEWESARYAMQSRRHDEKMTADEQAAECLRRR